MHETHYLSLGISFVNVIILLLLLAVYSKNLRHIRSKYNIGLLVFSLLFLVENIITIHLGIFTWPVILDAIVMSHIVIINLVELIGLSVLLYITWE